MQKSALFFLLLLFLIGCSKEAAQEELDYSKFPYLKPYIEAEHIEIRAGSLLVEQTSFDLDDDGVDEQLEMYIFPAPGVIIDGKFIEWGLDDAHLLQLIVRDGEKIYPLYNYNPHFASFKFWIPTDQAPAIVLMEQGNGLALYSYTYNKDEEYYEHSILYSSNGIPEYRSRFPR